MSYVLPLLLFICLFVCLLLLLSSLYGTARQDHTWDVISVDFGAVFSRNCSSADFYLWHPWDDRTKQPCLLGSMVAIERRNSSICCLIGRDYSRPVQFSKCSCTEDDFEW